MSVDFSNQTQVTRGSFKGKLQPVQKSRKNDRYYDQNSNDIFQTTNQIFQAQILKDKSQIEKSDDFNPHKFKNLMNVIQEETKNIKQNNKLNIQCQKNKDAISQSNTEIQFLDFDNEFGLQEFVNQYQELSQDQLQELINQNQDHFIHFFKICKCFRCKCGTCRCDYIIQGNNKLSFKGNFTTMYKSIFQPKNQINMAMFSPSNKQDRLWNNMPAQFGSTYRKDFVKKIVEKDFEKYQAKSNNDIFLITDSAYNQKFKYYPDLKQDLKNYKNHNMLVSNTKLNVNNKSEYHDTINKPKFPSFSEKIQNVDFKIPYGSHGKALQESIYKNDFNYETFEKFKKAKPMLNTLESLAYNKNMNYVTMNQSKSCRNNDNSCQKKYQFQKQNEKQFLQEKLNQAFQNRIKQ